MYRAIFEQLRHPIVETPWPRHIGFALLQALRIPWTLPSMFAEMRRRLATKRARRHSTA